MRISDPRLRSMILAVIGDPDAQKILLALHEPPKNAETVSEETSIPLSSVYRKIAELRDAGLVFVKSYEITEAGKRQDLFLSSVKELRLTFSGSMVEIELAPTEEFAERLWFRLFASR